MEEPVPHCLWYKYISEFTGEGQSAACSPRSAGHQGWWWALSQGPDRSEEMEHLVPALDLELAIKVALAKLVKVCHVRA